MHVANRSVQRILSSALRELQVTSGALRAMPAATNVISQTGRLLRSGVLKQPPAWWSVVQAHPPAPPSFARTHRKLDSQEPTSRTYEPSERRRKKLRPLKPKLPNIAFPVEDKIRLRFYSDHPWEAARAQSVVEADVLEDSPMGKDWITLGERKTNPSAEEYVVKATKAMLTLAAQSDRKSVV